MKGIKESRSDKRSNLFDISATFHVAIFRSIFTLITEEGGLHRLSECAKEFEDTDVSDRDGDKYVYKVLVLSTQFADAVAGPLNPSA